MVKTSNVSYALIIAQIIRLVLMGISSYILIYKGNNKSIIKISITLLIISLIILILDNLSKSESDSIECDCNKQGFYISQYEDEPLIRCLPSYNREYDKYFNISDTLDIPNNNLNIWNIKSSNNTNIPNNNPDMPPNNNGNPNRPNNTDIPPNGNPNMPNNNRSATINSNMNINDDDGKQKSVVKRMSSAFIHRFIPELGRNTNEMNNPWDNKVKKMPVNFKELISALKKPMKPGVLSYL